MNLDKFKARHGEEWIKLRNTSIIEDLISFLRDQDPARVACSADPTISSHNAKLLLGRSQGAEHITNWIDTGLSVEAPKPQADTSYTQDPLE